MLQPFSNRILRTIKQNNKKRIRTMYVESDASVRTQMSHVVVEIKNTKLVVARLAGTDANV